MRPHVLYVIPGLRDLTERRYGLSALWFTLFLLPVAVLFLHADVFLDGLFSFAWSSLVLITAPESFQKVFNTEIVEYWFASFFVVLWIACTIFFHRRKYVPGRNESESPAPWKLVWKEIRHNRFVLFFFCILIGLYAAACLAPWLAPRDPNAQQDIVVTKYAPPLTKMTFLRLSSVSHLTEPVDNDGALSQMIGLQKKLLRDRRDILFVQGYEKKQGEVHYQQGWQSKTLPLSTLVSESEDVFAGQQLFILGTDKYGRDIFSRLIYGSRISLSIGLLAMLIAVTLGTIIGASAGYFGGGTDTLLMRWVDLMLAFPNLFLVLMIVALFGNSILLIVVILGLTGWMGVARIVRGQFLSLREMEYIQAAKALGFGHARIIFKHLIPNAMAPIVVAATLRLGNIILIEAGLSFLGLGVQPPTASWGNMVADGRDVLLSAWWISTFPGLAIVLTVICFNVLGDGMRDALDPRLKS